MTRYGGDVVLRSGPPLRWHSTCASASTDECQHGRSGGVVPTYEYRCKDCGTELEVVQSFTDDALTTCEACGGQLRKVFGNVGISFKGSGFYKTDSKPNGTSDGKKADSTSDKPEKKTDTADTKTADKKADTPAPATSSSSTSSSSTSS
jgi:putative FmdB family regulatory protein